MDFDSELLRMADSYTEQGYRTTIRPAAGALPEFAKDFRVEILGERGDGGVLVAVKRDRDELADDANLPRYAAIIAEQPRWRFDLAVVGPEKPSRREINDAADFAEGDIEGSFEDATKLVDSGYPRPAVITAWAGFEAAMRSRLRAEGEAAGWGSPPLDLLTELYTIGIIATDEFPRLETLYRVRNQIAHGYLSDLAHEGGAVQFLAEVGRRLVAESRPARASA